MDKITYLIVERLGINGIWYTFECIGFAHIGELVSRAGDWSARESLYKDSVRLRIRC